MTSDDQDTSRKSGLRMQSEIFSHEGELVWSIKDFPKFKNKSHYSNEFSIVPCCEKKWKISLSVNDSVAETQIDIFRNDNDIDVWGECICSLENSQGVVYKSCYIKGFFSYKNTYRLKARDNLLNWDLISLQDTLLIIKFQIKLRDCCTKTVTVKSEYQNSFPKHKLSTDLHRGLQMLLNEKTLSDVNLNVNGTIIPVHKTILCARSPVFRKMLEKDMKEAKDGVIEIEDIQPDIMKEFVSYLYTDTIGNEVSLDVMRELYAVADKYEVGSLQDKCGTVLLDNLNENTVCKTLKLADLHNDDILKEAASIYIGGNYPALKHSLDFKSLVESDPRLVLHILMCKCLD